MNDRRTGTADVRVLVRAADRFDADTARDAVAAEEPLQLRIEHGGRNTDLAITMRTPGDDAALAVGFLLSEGIIDGPDDVIEARLCREAGPDGGPVENVVQVFLDPRVEFDPARFQRNVYTTSSCGVCGKASVDALEVVCAVQAPTPGLVDAATIAALPAVLRGRQEVFEATGGLHATAIFTRDGRLEDVREDVGRHNAMDKVIGRALLAGRLPLHDRLLLVSGRVSFELVQKAARAGVPFLAAIGAPSTLALDAAERLGVTVVGFLREDRFNVYTHPARVRVDAALPLP